MKRLFRRQLMMAAVLLSLAAPTGCGSSSSPGALGQVEGIVTLDGVPYAGAIVELNPKEKSSPGERKEGAIPVSGSVGVTGPDGRYVLQFNNVLKGAVVGTHSVKVSDLPDNDDGPPRTIKLPIEYSVQNGQTFDVVKGSNTLNLDLKSRNTGKGHNVSMSR